MAGGSYFLFVRRIYAFKRPGGDLYYQSAAESGLSACLGDSGSGISGVWSHVLHFS